MRLVFLCCALLACPAEDFGVVVPTGGIDSVSNEDLQRDVWAMMRPVSGEQMSPTAFQADRGSALSFVKKRLLDMGATPIVGKPTNSDADAKDSLCAVREGRTSNYVLLSVKDIGEKDYLFAGSVAGLIGLAKAIDVEQDFSSAVIFCVFPSRSDAGPILKFPGYPVEHLKKWVELGPLGLPGELRWGKPGDKPQLVTALEQDLSREGESIKDLDYRVLLKQVRSIYDAVLSSLNEP